MLRCDAWAYLFVMRSPRKDSVDPGAVEVAAVLGWRFFGEKGNVTLGHGWRTLGEVLLRDELVTRVEESRARWGVWREGE
jgi:hypothetical protein